MTFRIYLALRKYTVELKDISYDVRKSKVKIKGFLSIYERNIFLWCNKTEQVSCKKKV